MDGQWQDGGINSRLNGADDSATFECSYTRVKNTRNGQEGGELWSGWMRECGWRLYTVDSEYMFGMRLDND